MTSFERRLGLGALWLSALASGCTGSEIAVGAERGEGLDRCVGVADCTAEATSRPMPPSKPGECASDSVGALTIAFAFSPQKRLCPPVEVIPCEDARGKPATCLPENSGCTTNIQAARPAPDGSIWLTVDVGTMGPKGQDRRALWLGHIGADGAELQFTKLGSGTALRDNTTYYETDIAVDAHGDAYIAIYGLDPGPNADAQFAEHTWLEHFDAAGTRVGGALELPGLARALVRVADDGRIVIAGDATNIAKRAIVAVLDDGALVWSQPKVRSEGNGSMYGLGVDAAGNVLVHTRTLAGKGKAEGQGFVTTRFNAEGERSWQLGADKAFQPGYGAGFDVDGAGNFAAIAYPAAPPTNRGPTGLVVSVDPKGELRWSFQIPEAQLGLSVARASGTVYVVAWSSLLQITSEGACRRFDHDSSVNPPNKVQEGPNGQLYFDDGSVVGRYKPLPAQ